MLLFLNTVEKVNAVLNDFIWGPVMLVLLLGTGIYFSIRTNMLQVRKFGYIWKHTIMTIFDKTEITDKKAITPFQALTTALAATVGTGNIVGVATAISIGGPGSVFWIWICAFFGMMTKYSEILLSIKFRRKNDHGDIVGGPMYYIQDGLKLKWLAVLFAIFGFLASFGIGNLTQVNSIASSINNAFKIPPLVTGLAVAILTGFIIIGGVKRIAQTTEKIVPFMAIFYIVISIIVLVVNGSKIPAAFGLIFSHALKPTAAFGGFAGATIMMTIKNGMARGIFSNEAGLGSAPIAHAVADTSHPCKQAMWGVFEVFVDTIIICTLTGLVIVSSGQWSSGLDGSDLTIAAFSTGIGGFASYALAIAIFFFAFSTVISWSFYGEKCLEYLVGSSKLNIVYKCVFVVVIVIGAISELKLVWNIADTLNGFMAVPNLIGLLGLSGVVISYTKEYFSPDKLKNTNK